jgi:hypothetical protein
MPEILPSFYRVHEGGINSLVSLEQQYARRIQTFAAISSYYRRIGNSELEKFFLGEIYKISFITPKLHLLLTGLSATLKTVLKSIGLLHKKL